MAFIGCSSDHFIVFQVDGDVRSSLPPAKQDSLAAAAAHAALLSAANVGTGYTAYV